MDSIFSNYQVAGNLVRAQLASDKKIISFSSFSVKPQAVVDSVGYFQTANQP